MDEAQQVSTLIAGIYDAALDPSLWPVVLRKASGFVNGSAASLFSKDATSKTGVIYYDDGGLDPHYVRTYFDKYVKLDPSTTSQFFAEIEEPFATADFVSYDEFLETRFYKEWVKPQGLVDCINAVLDKSVTGMAMFGVFRKRQHGLADDAARRAMRLIVPHVRRAVLVSRTIELKSTAADTFASVLDGLSAGMFLVDAHGRIVHANSAGHALLAEGNFLRAVGGRLAHGLLADDRERHPAGPQLEVRRCRAHPHEGRDGVVPFARSLRVLPVTGGAAHLVQLTPPLEELGVGGPGVLP